MELDKELSFSINKKSYRFRTIYSSEINELYIDGLKQQVKYMKNIPENVNMENQVNYIDNIIIDRNNTICGLFMDDELVATSGIQINSNGNYFRNIDFQAKELASIGIFVFNKRHRGLGLGSVLVWAGTYLLHECTQTVWYRAAMEKDNVPSLKSFLSCGYSLIGEDERYHVVSLNISNLIQPKFILNYTFN